MFQSGDLVVQELVIGQVAEPWVANVVVVGSRLGPKHRAAKDWHGGFAQKRRVRLGTMHNDRIACSLWVVGHFAALPHVLNGPKRRRRQFDGQALILHNPRMQWAFCGSLLFCVAALTGCSCDSGNAGEGADGGGTNRGDGSTSWPDGGGPSGRNDGGTCEQITVGSTLEAPEVLVVFDQSLSMNTGGRWDAAVQAVGSVVVTLDLQVAFGIGFFGTGSRGACGAVDVPIPPRVGSAAEISDELNRRSPAGYTPIAPMLDLISRLKAGEVVSGQPPLPNLETIILMTDGAPNCNEALDGNSCTCTQPDCSNEERFCLDDVRSVDAVGKLAEQGVTTYVIGYSVSEWKSTLDAMAAAGSPGGTYFPVENATDLESSLGGIAAGITSCSFELESTPEDVTYVSVTLNGDPVPHTSQSNAGDGWELQGNTVNLLGTDCAAAKSDPRAVLDIKVECEQVFVIR